jgi:hypothetical protein
MKLEGKRTEKESQHATEVLHLSMMSSMSERGRIMIQSAILKEKNSVQMKLPGESNSIHEYLARSQPAAK